MHSVIVCSITRLIYFVHITFIDPTCESRTTFVTAAPDILIFKRRELGDARPLDNSRAQRRLHLRLPPHLQRRLPLDHVEIHARLPQQPNIRLPQFHPRRLR